MRIEDEDEKKRRLSIIPDGGVVRASLLLMDSAKLRVVDGQPLTDSEAQAFDGLLGAYGATAATNDADRQRAISDATAEFRRQRGAADALERQVQISHSYAEGARIACAAMAR